MSLFIVEIMAYVFNVEAMDIIKIGDVVDHIIPIRMDWSKRLEPTNLQTLCHACHNKKTKKMRRKTKIIRKKK